MLLYTITFIENTQLKLTESCSKIPEMGSDVNMSEDMTHAGMTSLGRFIPNLKGAVTCTMH